ncbi:MAG: ChaN family lipoprotein [Desulfobacterales bacterium]
MKNQGVAMYRKTNTKTNARVVRGRWIFSLAIFGLMVSCAGTPEKVVTPDTVKSLRPDTIISAQSGKEATFDEMMADLNHHQIIFVGEQHTNVSHHSIQLKIIQAAFRNNHNLVVGMEMFDRSYQEVLDLWTAGVLDEEAFLRKTHWYANWRYDFSLYRDILLFIKQNKIKLVALNLPFHIPGRIRVGGIDNLSISDKRYLPKEIDTANSAHRTYAQKIFEQHQFSSHVNFEDFYMAQCVWDEIMAESIAKDLGSKKIIALMGNGHIQYKYGVPNRTFRRTGASFRTVYLAPAGAEVDLTIGDFIWITATE